MVRGRTEREMKLSDRLEMVVSFVKPAEAAADIGTDHGHVPVELVRRGIVVRAYAMDVRKGPLSKAEENIQMAGYENRIETRLSDGVEKLSPGEADAVIIAGMGGELIVHILENGRHIWDTVDQWVLSPHSEIFKVRKWLWENGFPVEREAMVHEEGKYYTVLGVGRRVPEMAGNGADGTSGNESGGEVRRTDRDFLYGEYLIQAKDPVFLDFLKDEEKKLLALSENLEKQAKMSERAMESLKDVTEKLTYNREVQHEMQGTH